MNAADIERPYRWGEGEICRVELVRKGDVRVFVSSSEVYGDAEVFLTPEFYGGKVDPLSPRSWYEEGKRFGEACKAYGDQYWIDVRIGSSTVMVLG